MLVQVKRQLPNASQLLVRHCCPPIMPFDLELEEWKESQQHIEEEDLDYDIENPDEDEPTNKIGKL